MCRKSPSDFEKRIDDLIEALKKNDHTKYNSIKNKLNPKDKEVKVILEEYEFERKKQKYLAKILLRMIIKKNTKEELTPNKELTLEHIHPESRSKELKDPRLVNKLGNLTLILESQNRKVGNKPYQQKRIFIESPNL